MFDWFSLDFIYYPVSAIMWVWYKAFAFVLGPSNFFAWALSVMFLVFTLRAILYKPFVRQIRTTRQMQELQPQIKALQKKYGKDRQRMALEMQKLQREHGFNPLLGCLPMLRAGPGVPRAVPRAALVQPNRDQRLRRQLRAAPVGGAEPGDGQLHLQRAPTSGTSWTRTCSARRSARR